MPGLQGQLMTGQQIPKLLLPSSVKGERRYRWHVPDPTRFKPDLRVTIQALGWHKPLAGKRRYLPLQDDIASTAIWYQPEPNAPFPDPPMLNYLKVI